MKQKLRCETALSSQAREAQTGRSMVEMLGVLAIIGVLSIGGIIGYTQAMNQYKVNEIVEAIHQRAVVAAPKCLDKKNANVFLPEFPDTILGGEIVLCGAQCTMETVGIHWAGRDCNVFNNLCPVLKNSSIAQSTYCSNNQKLSEFDCDMNGDDPCGCSFSCTTTYLLDLEPFDWECCGANCAL